LPANRLAAFLALLLLAAPAYASSRCPAVELDYDDDEQLSQKRSDTNQDCRHDEFVFYVNGKAERAERDRDFDGRIDVWIFCPAGAGHPR
jgi:azurin